MRRLVVISAVLVSIATISALVSLGPRYWLTLSFSANVTPQGGGEADAEFHTYSGLFTARVEWDTPEGHKDKIYVVSDFGHKREVDDDMFADTRDAAHVSVAFLLLSIIGALGACYPLMFLAADDAHPTKQTLAAYINAVVGTGYVISATIFVAACPTTDDVDEYAHRLFPSTSFSMNDLNSEVYLGACWALVVAAAFLQFVAMYLIARDKRQMEERMFRLNDPEPAAFHANPYGEPAPYPASYQTVPPIYAYPQPAYPAEHYSAQQSSPRHDPNGPDPFRA